MKRGMAIALCAGLTFVMPARAEDYSSVIAKQRDGNGYAPAVVVAGWEQDASFSVLAFAPDGKRTDKITATTEWKATLIVGPRAPAKDTDDDDDDRYLDKSKVAVPQRAAPKGPPVQRREVMWTSLTCPAVMERMKALQPLATFTFEPPTLKGNEDGPAGDGREGFDLWIRASGAELNKAAESQNSKLAAWFKDSLKALEACPPGKKP